MPEPMICFLLSLLLVVAEAIAWHFHNKHAVYPVKSSLIVLLPSFWIISNTICGALEGSLLAGWNLISLIITLILVIVPSAILFVMQLKND